MRYLSLILFCPLIVSAATVTPKSINAELQKYGNGFSTHVSQADWNTSIENISAGKSEWLSLVPKLAPVLNQDQANQLTDALYYAIAPNAKDTLKTLAILDKQKNKYQQGTDTSCLFPLDKPKGQTEKTYNDTRLSLLDASPKAATCLWLLEGWMEEVQADVKRGHMHWVSE